MVELDLARVEEAGLNALQTQRQLFFDGWLLRVSPGAAKRARSVNAHFGSTLPLPGKIAHCEAVYGTRGLPTLFRMTPFQQPPDLDAVLERHGYVAFDRTLVQVLALTAPPSTDGVADVALEAPPIGEFVAAVGELRASSPEQCAAHFERLGSTPLMTHAVIARVDGRPAACGQATLDHGLAGVFDMVTADFARCRGLARLIVHELLTWAWSHGASHAYLQVNDTNAPALAVYRRFGFETAYTYHYRARPDECR